MVTISHTLESTLEAALARAKVRGDAKQIEALQHSIETEKRRRGRQAETVGGAAHRSTSTRKRGLSAPVPPSPY